MEWFKKAWRGEELCWKVFWIYGVLFAAAMNYAAVRLEHTFMMNPPLKFSFVLFNFFYLIWIVVATYRCGKNVGIKFFGFCARLLAVLFPLVFFATVFAGGVQKGQMMIEAAKCKRVAIDAKYGDANPEVLKRCKQAAEKARKRR
ncbi:MAG: hypothetical protein ACAH80_15290 [Alphaproteobacteria bacterium]